MDALKGMWVASRFREGKHIEGLDEILSQCVCYDLNVARLKIPRG